MASVEALLATSTSLSSHRGGNYLPLMWKFYKGQRATLFRVARSLAIQSTTEDHSLIDALAFVIENDQVGRRGEFASGEFDLSFASERWRKLVEADEEEREPLVDQLCVEFGPDPTPERYVGQLKDLLSSTAEEMDWSLLRECQRDHRRRRGAGLEESYGQEAHPRGEAARSCFRQAYARARPCRRALLRRALDELVEAPGIALRLGAKSPWHSRLALIPLCWRNLLGVAPPSSASTSRRSYRFSASGCSSQSTTYVAIDSRERFEGDRPNRAGALRIAGVLDSYNKFVYSVFMLRATRAKSGQRETGGVEDLAEVARGMRDAKGILSEVEIQALSGVASVLAETAESLARTADRLEMMRPTEWMDAEQAAAYLADRSRDSFDKVAPSLPKHYLTERRPLYNRREIDDWLMSR